MNGKNSVWLFQWWAQRSDSETDERGDKKVFGLFFNNVPQGGCVARSGGMSSWTDPKRLFFEKGSKRRGILGLIRVDWGAGFLQNANEFYQQWTGINDVLCGYVCVPSVESKDRHSEPISSNWHCEKYSAVVHQDGLFPFGFVLAPVWRH